MIDRTTPTTPPSLEGGTFFLGYKRRREAIRAVEPADLVPINVDLAAAVTTVRAAWPRIAEHRESIAATLSDFDIGTLDALDDYAVALGHLHSLSLCAPVPAATARVLRARAIEIRAGLLLDALALSRHGLLDRGRLAQVRRGPGYENAVFDLLGLVNMFRDAWPTIATSTPVTLEALVEAEAVANELSVAIGRRKRTPEVLAALALERQQAFTLLARAYEQVRFAIAYLRRTEGDTDTIAPSIYAGRRRRRRREASLAEQEALPNTPHAEAFGVTGVVPVAATSAAANAGAGAGTSAGAGARTNSEAAPSSHDAEAWSSGQLPFATAPLFLPKTFLATRDNPDR